MARYIPSNVPRKKAVTLERREAELIHEIDSFVISDFLREAAERVRDAQIGYLKAKKHFAFDPGSGSAGKRYEQEIGSWRKKTIEQIIDEYKRQSRQRGN